MKKKSYYVYILLTQRQTLYCGYTDDVLKRFRKHKIGKGAKYTRSYKPVKLVYVQKFSSRKEAMKEEYRLKQLSKTQKWTLIKKQRFSLLKIILYFSSRFL